MDGVIIICENEWRNKSIRDLEGALLEERTPAGGRPQRQVLTSLQETIEKCVWLSGTKLRTIIRYIKSEWEPKDAKAFLGPTTSEAAVLPVVRRTGLFGIMACGEWFWAGAITEDFGDLKNFQKKVENAPSRKCMTLYEVIEKYDWLQADDLALLLRYQRCFKWGKMTQFHKAWQEYESNRAQGQSAVA